MELILGSVAIRLKEHKENVPIEHADGSIDETKFMPSVRTYIAKIAMVML